jgi:hypothetical protein
MTYDDLIQIVQDEAIDIEASFTSDNIELLVQRAQLRIQRDVDLNATRAEETWPLTAGQHLVALPQNVITIRGVRVESGDWLLEKDTTFLRDYWPDASQTAETPKYYAWRNDQDLEVAPTPANDVDLEVEYTERIPLLSPSQQTNWISEYVPDLMQAAMLVEAAKWSKDQEQLQTYMQEYRATLQAVAIEQNFRVRTDEYRVGSPEMRPGRRAEQ